MKKALVFMLAMVLILCLCACNRAQVELPFAKEYTFPENTSVLGVDVTGLTKEEAWTKLEAAVDGYSLELTVDGVTLPITAQEIDLSGNQNNFLAGAAAMEQGTAADFSGVICFNEGKLRQLLSLNFNKDVTEASITFDEATLQYVLVPHADGQKSNPNALVSAVKDAIFTLSPSHTLTGVSEILHPVRSADDPEVQEALALANKMISAKLAYTYNGSAAQEIPAETLRSFVVLGEDGLTPVINDETLDAYITEMSDKYSVAGTSGPFKTTGGGTVNLTVSYNGLYVDNEGLKNDIIACMKDGISETRTAPYRPSGNRDMPYGGSYVEVDLSAQKLYLYKNGERLLTTSLVSGKVSANWCTPTGVYSIYSKSAGAYLVGEDYRTYVNYWMPFHYGYGLHDATWRGSFGGEIYLYSGSHGCVNLPLKAAATIFNNVSVGTKVILYGGQRSVPPVQQVLTGSTSYDVAEDAGTFKLNIKAKYGTPKLTYSSSNTKVATVDEAGNVTIKGIGKATITVEAAKQNQYSETKTTVTINVHSACDEGRHTMGTGVTITAPTCQPGLEKVTCTKCGHSTEQEMKPVESHTYGAWVTTKEPTCGAEGTQERICSKCNIQKETGTVAATGNHTGGNWVTTKEPTCVEDGAKENKCTVCNASLGAEKVPATGVHVSGDWQTVQDATCTEAGVRKKYCVHCGAETESGSIEAGHKAGDWQTVNSATCTADGKKVKNCTRCGTELESAVISSSGHKFNDGPSCERCGEANPNYTVPSTEASE